MNLLECQGKRFRCNLISHGVVEGRIQVQCGRIYLCQNSADGQHCSDKLGYKYSWILSAGYETNPNNSPQNISNFYLLSEDGKIIEDTTIFNIDKEAFKWISELPGYDKMDEKEANYLLNGFIAGAKMSERYFKKT
jgi:hypothetical protein